MSRMYNYFYNEVYIKCGYITPDGEEDGYEGNMIEFFNCDTIEEADDLFCTYYNNVANFWDAIYHAIKDIVIKKLPEGAKLTSLYVCDEESGHIIHDENEPI